MDNGDYAYCYNNSRSDIDDQALAILTLISNLISDPSEISVLDIGSGPGRLAIPIGQKVNKMVCIESDLNAVNYLENRAKENHIEIKVYPSKLEYLSSEEIGQFNLVILSHILHWFDPSLLLDLSKKYVVNNGYILLSLFDLESLKKMLFYNISGKKILEIQEAHTPSTDHIETLLNKAGFEVVQRIKIPLVVNYGNGKLESIINSMGTLAWQKAKEILSVEEYTKLKTSALARLNHEHQLNDTEYRTMILAQKRDCPNDLD